MRGARPLNDGELETLLAAFSGKHALRDRALLILACLTGFRISSLLSLTCGDVFQCGALVDRVAISRQNMKAKRQGGDSILHPRAKAAVGELVKSLASRPDFGPGLYLFQSQLAGNRPLTRKGAWDLLKRAYRRCGITGKVSCHSTRKYYAAKIYQATHDLLMCQRALHHRSFASTLSYVSVDQGRVDQAVLGI